MEMLKKKVSQLRLETQEAHTKADEAIEEKKEAISRVEEVSQVHKCTAAFVQRSTFSEFQNVYACRSKCPCMQSTYVYYLLIIIAFLNCAVGN